jgi:hypothetical protein
VVDAELVGSDDFYEVILQALNNSKAAIVIWTKTSTKSRFVRDEARFALHLNKLVATKESSLDIFEIPFGFQGQHTDDVTNLEQVMRALEKFGVKPVGTAAPGSDGLAGWNKLKIVGGIDDLVAFLGTNPPDQERQAAMARLKELSAGPHGAKGSSAVVRALTMTNLQAFLSAFTSRMSTKCGGSTRSVRAPAAEIDLRQRTPPAPRMASGSGKVRTWRTRGRKMM